LSHCRKVARQAFPYGWDRAYKDHVWSSVPTVSSCLEAGRAKGGARSVVKDRPAFLRRCLDGGGEQIGSDVRFFNVRKDGKDRGVTITSAQQQVLAPLHRTIYSHLSSLPWLLRGEAKASRFKNFIPVEGEVFVSGDYEAATDHLPIEVVEVFLDVLQSTACWIPASVWRDARVSLRSKIWYEDLDAPLDQVVGQLMGNFLSFPFLCLQNYCAFRFVFPDSTPVKINGDDIVFRSTPAQFGRWADFVSSVGLVLSRGKTMVDRRFFSLNSTFFRSLYGGCVLVPVIRTAGLLRRSEDMGGLSGALRRFGLGWSGRTLERLQVLFLKRSGRQIRESGRSVWRGLGVRTSIPVLQASGLWRRECWYLDSVPVEHYVPSPCRLKWTSPPPGWKRVPKSSRPEVANREKEYEKVFWSDLVNRAWSGPESGFSNSDYWRQLTTTGYEGHYQRWRADAEKWKRLCKGHLPSIRRWRVTTDSARKFFERTCEKASVWVPVEDPPVQLSEKGACAAELVDWWSGGRGYTCVPPPIDYSPQELFTAWD